MFTSILTSIIGFQLSLIVLVWVIGFPVRPYVSYSATRISARPSMVFLFLTLFLHIKAIEFSKTTNTVKIEIRNLWLLKNSEEFKFDEIQSIKYNFSSFIYENKHWGYNEEFYTKLILKNGREVNLFSFFGGDIFSSQENKSREFINNISKLTSEFNIRLTK